MPYAQLHPTAQRTAYTMVATYKADALFVAEREVSARIIAEDFEMALQMDQVRREIIFILAG
jgi:hypothetical protein